ncbi:hypothetical protein CLV56_4012 [Mumia flava]|uniref:Uncharacterized protein n=1 Tax=Mumia flava TaxID=1348852 RepID=A0A0B2BTF4_9ACTN|nr:hypothetical protein [Mumia flava]PJJ48307.1 hypothetical protein CLV56_4012 [Mumia flava]
MKTYRNHRCSRKHRTTKTFMQCAYPRAEWVVGEGKYAVLAWCSVLTVTLWSNREAAFAALAEIDNLACGGRCTRRHDIVRIELEETS